WEINVPAIAFLDAGGHRSARARFHRDPGLDVARRVGAPLTSLASIDRVCSNRDVRTCHFALRYGTPPFSLFRPAHDGDFCVEFGSVVQLDPFPLVATTDAGESRLHRLVAKVFAPLSRTFQIQGFYGSR